MIKNKMLKRKALIGAFSFAFLTAQGMEDVFGGKNDPVDALEAYYTARKKAKNWDERIEDSEDIRPEEWMDLDWLTKVVVEKNFTSINEYKQVNWLGKGALVTFKTRRKITIPENLVSFNLSWISNETTRGSEERSFKNSATYRLDLAFSKTTSDGDEVLQEKVHDFTIETVYGISSDLHTQPLSKIVARQNHKTQKRMQTKDFENSEVKIREKVRIARQKTSREIMGKKPPSRELTAEELQMVINRAKGVQVISGNIIVQKYLERESEPPKIQQKGLRKHLKRTKSLKTVSMVERSKSLYREEEVENSKESSENRSKKLKKSKSSKHLKKLSSRYTDSSIVVPKDELKGFDKKRRSFNNELLHTVTPNKGSKKKKKRKNS